MFIPIRLQVRPNQFGVESGREIGGDQYLRREGAFLARSTPDHKSYRFIKVREMINNLTTRLRSILRGRTQGLCGTEMTTNAHPQLKTSMENLAMEVAKLFAQVSHQVDNDLSWK